MVNGRQRFWVKNWPEVAFIIFAFLFSLGLMMKTFGSDPHAGTITIATKAYSDFAANIPLIRSFSWGENFPPQYPIFSGEPIRYHFLFYLLVGVLEKAGVPLGWALNLPSALGFFALLLMIYFLSYLLFKNRAIALLGVLFFLFNGSFGFYYFFQKHPFVFPSGILEIFKNQEFSAFGPYDQGPVTAFWNLNIYTNQRHFASGLFFALLPLYIVLRVRKNNTLSLKTSLLLGVMVGLLPFWHATGFMMALVILGGLFLMLPHMRKSIFITLLVSAVLSLPQYLYLSHSGGISSFHFKPGYLISGGLTAANFLNFWLLNFGLGFFLIPLGVFLAPRNAKIAFLSVLPIFVLGNLIQFSPDIAINHKFFNLFLIVGNIFTAVLLVNLWQKSLVLKPLVLVLIFFLTFSGIIDFLAIKNDRLYTMSDVPQNPDVVWIKENTPPSSVFLNSSYLYHPASLAGRKIFLGWPYFSWSAGYDTDGRIMIQKKLYLGEQLTAICQLLRQNRIDYVETQRSPDQEILINYKFWESFSPAYQNSQTGLKIYPINQICRWYLEEN